MISNDPNDWDDTVILKVFHDSLKKHTTREKEKEKTQINSTKDLEHDSFVLEEPHIMARENTDHDIHSGGKRKLDQLDKSVVVGNELSQNKTASKKPVGFQAALSNFLSSKKKVTNDSNKSLSVMETYSMDQTRAVQEANAVVHDQPHSSRAANPNTKHVQFSEDCHDKQTKIQETSQAFDQSCYNYGYYPQPQVAANNITSKMIDEALQTMLMAWYQSGYATGRYQTLCEVSGYSSGVFSGASKESNLEAHAGDVQHED